MEESIPENQEETLVEGTLNTAEDDEFAEIREHFESGIALTDEETDKVADLAVDYLKKILTFFGETESSIDEYDGDEGELILDVNGGDLAVLIGRHGRTLDALQMVLTHRCGHRELQDPSQEEA